MNYSSLKPIGDVKAESQKIHVELGCGDNRRDMEGYENIGIDLVGGKQADIVCNLGFEDIPLPSDHVDFVQGIDFIEHVPKCVWESKHGIKIQRLLPLVHVMNEVWRIMKHNAEFYLETPFSHWAHDRDPTHVSRLAEDWGHYFSADDNLYYDQGIVTCNFKPKDVSFKPYKNKDDTLCTRLIAIKA